MVCHRNDHPYTQPFWHLWEWVFFRHGTPKHFEGNFSFGGKFRLPISPFFSPPWLHLSNLHIQSREKVTKDTKTGHEKIIVTYFGDKCSILVVFNILIQCIHNFRWKSVVFQKIPHVFCCWDTELYEEPNKIWRN